MMTVSFSVKLLFDPVFGGESPALRSTSDATLVLGVYAVTVVPDSGCPEDLAELFSFPAFPFDEDFSGIFLEARRTRVLACFGRLEDAPRVLLLLDEICSLAISYSYISLSEGRFKTRLGAR